MKNTIKNLSFFLVLFCFFLSFSGIVQAQITELPDVGMLPDSPFYFLKSWGESIGTLFTFGNINKAERFLGLAERRLVEANALMEKEKLGEAERTLERYQKQLAQSLERAERAKEKGDDVDDVLIRISEQTLKHQEALVDVYERVSEQARPAIERAMNSGIRGHEEALKAISSQKREEIIESLDEIRGRVEKKKEQLQERGISIPKTPREIILEIEKETGIEIPQELKEVLDQIPGLSAKYKQITINKAKGLELKMDVWQKGSKVRAEMKDGPTEAIIVVDLIDRKGWTYVPKTNMAIAIDPEIYMKEIQNITGGNVWDHEPIIVGSENIEGLDALVVEYTVLDTKITQWLAKDYGLILRVESEREGEITEIKTIDIEFVDIPDEKFQLPAGVQMQKIPTEIFEFMPQEEDMKKMMEGVGEMEGGIKDLEKMMEGVDIESMMDF